MKSKTPWQDRYGYGEPFLMLLDDWGIKGCPKGKIKPIEPVPQETIDKWNREAFEKYLRVQKILDKITSEDAWV